MPVFNDDMVSQAVGGTKGTFNFSGTRPEKLTALEYTLVTIAVDTTGSVTGFAPLLTEMTRTIIKGCRKAPRAENLLVRVVEFNSVDGVKEHHGFKLVRDIQEDSEYSSFHPRGNTNLYDTVHSSIQATLQYAKMLTDQDMIVNAATYFITDGEDNASSVGPQTVAQTLQQVQRDENLESLMSIVIGINAAQCHMSLDAFVRDTGMNQFIDAKDATPQNCAKVANFVSKSVSSVSQAVSTGGPSQTLSF